MSRPLRMFHQSNKRALGAYWDEVVNRAPATPIPIGSLPADLGGTIRHIHGLEEQSQHDIPFKERQLQMLLAHHQELNTMSAVAMFSANRLRLVTEQRSRVDFGRIQDLWDAKRLVSILASSALLTLVVIAALMATNVFDRTPDQGDRPAVYAPGTPIPSPSPESDPAAASLIWKVTGDQSGLSFPVGVAIGPDGNIYVVDAGNDRIQVFSPDGTSIGLRGGPGSDPGKFRFHDEDFYNGGIGFDGDGNAYVFDSLNDRIQKFDSKWVFLREWGTSGTDNGQFSLPVGAIDAANGLLYVADYGNNRIQVFDLEGNFLDKWGEYGQRDGEFDHPNAVAVGGDGSVYVGEDGGNRVQHFSRTGRLLDPVGNGRFAHIYGLAQDTARILYASGGLESAIWVFGQDGAEIATIEEVAGLGALHSPAGIAIADDGTAFLAMMPPGPDQITPANSMLIKFRLPEFPGN
jgi:DNA-binding beta-propeller fold protein YncE